MSNQVYSNNSVQYSDDEYNFILSGLPKIQQTFATFIFGPISAFPFTIKYIISNNQVYLSWNLAITTSTTGAVSTINTLNALPINIRPTRSLSYPCSLAIGNNAEDGFVTINTTGLMSFSRCTVPPLYPNATLCGVNFGSVLYSIT